MTNAAALTRLLKDKQDFFLPYYRQVVADYPLGILAADVKSEVRRRIVAQFGFDPFDAQHTGYNPSTSAAAASQWANNLVSNKVLDQYMTVVREGRATLYPLSAEPPQARVDDNGGYPPRLDSALKRATGERLPQKDELYSSQWVRSEALAALVREEFQYRCTIGTTDCRGFTARGGNPYVEVHHILPMAAQAETAYNLDRFENMVAVCVRCHAIMHRGIAAEAFSTLEALLLCYESRRGVRFEEAMASSQLEVSAQALLARY